MGDLGVREIRMLLPKSCSREFACEAAEFQREEKPVFRRKGALKPRLHGGCSLGSVSGTHERYEESSFSVRENVTRWRANSEQTNWKERILTRERSFALRFDERGSRFERLA